MRLKTARRRKYHYQKFETQKELDFFVLLAALKARPVDDERPHETRAAAAMIARLTALLTPKESSIVPLRAVNGRRRRCECGEGYVGECAPCEALHAQAARLNGRKETRA